MKKTYLINDIKHFRESLEKEGIKAEDLENLLSQISPFNVIYALEGEPHGGTQSYTLVDAITGEKIMTTELNGYQKSLINDCYANFHKGNDEELLNRGIKIEVS